MELLTIKQASKWATEHLGKDVTESNISYLIQYGCVKKIGENGSTQIAKEDLYRYYEVVVNGKAKQWKCKLGDNLNWDLSFDTLSEAERTKHVHRLHPYKGKFIPQLVEYFLDGHIDNFKTDVYFHKGDTVLDPFCGSGTLLVQSNELGMHAVGIDVSEFNALISNIKIASYDFIELQKQIQFVTRTLMEYVNSTRLFDFERELENQLNLFNNEYFPSAVYRYQVRNCQIDERSYGSEKAKQFEAVYAKLIEKYNIKLIQEAQNTFLDKWYLKPVRKEIDLMRNVIYQIKDEKVRNILIVILSRTIRSCRATTHSDLATLLEPMAKTYYCQKHGKICKPLFSISDWWNRYSIDTVKRLKEFEKIRTNTYQCCLVGDSRTIDITKEIEMLHIPLSKEIAKKPISGIFSSPPYIGLIDYHEQHAYSYELFGFTQRKDLEIGTLSEGKGMQARQNYVQSISDVLKNCLKHLVDDPNIFLVANDKYNLYSSIAEKAGLVIVNQFNRPVLCRTEKDKAAYSESIFHMKRKT